ncbi:hypothetical protein GAU_0219 [Gemmatimonas aurantiaca T-27]|uniref:Peptidase C51 domain-containing protein n=1 Tax=Gemmatimonas aurantiaca (strain DSM 14586 / JCM 11422 / NBRC 100505 / T-27) TaxID=379066 RepID=C1A4V1_GEMAT|nr:hypothetical protein [Gemmatimonas aurantiaca]BAH37261.1 hypothetical protein GAU_0219 [Gemmatimonas aurantiaca T-27]
MIAHATCARRVGVLVSRSVAIAATTLTVASASLLHAQPAAAPDSSAIASRFARQTIDSLVRSLTAADSLLDAPTSAPPLHAKLQDLFSRLTRPEIGSRPLQDLVAERARFSDVARRRVRALTTAEAAAIDTLAALAEQSVRRPLAGAAGAARTRELFLPVDAFNSARRRQSLAESLERLRRFERKYGPEAPTRNIVEVGLNYAAQWLPLFGPRPDESPSRLELSAAYVPTWISMPRKGIRSDAVSVAEAGLRVYIWKPGWGGDAGGVLRPGHVTVGALVAGAHDGALESPFQGNSRFGAYVAWGNAKIGFIGGRDSRILLTRKVQLLPWTF